MMDVSDAFQYLNLNIDNLEVIWLQCSDMVAGAYRNVANGTIEASPSIRLRKRSLALLSTLMQIQYPTTRKS